MPLLQNGKLLPQGQVLQEQIATRAKGPDQRYEQKPQQAQHGASLTRKDRRDRLHFYLTDSAADRNCGEAQVPTDERTPELIHRLDKADTRNGIASIQPLADLGVPYAMLLYERFLGRPFAGHRDSVSELVGDVLETAIEGVLTRAGISHRKTKRAERVTGFDQAPDFIIPNVCLAKTPSDRKITSLRSEER